MGFEISPFKTPHPCSGPAMVTVSQKGMGRDFLGAREGEVNVTKRICRCHAFGFKD
jgi:hypothetical protein